MATKVKFKCACDQVYIADDKWFGRKIRCPKCQRALVVPTPAGAAPAAEKKPDPAAPQPAPDEAEAPAVEAPPQDSDDVFGTASAGGIEIELEDPTETEVAPEPAADIGTPIETAAAAPAAPAAGESAGGEGAGAAHVDPADLSQCPHCTNDLPKGSVFCVNCGTDLRSGRKLRKVQADDDGPTYDPPEEGSCCMCGEEGVQVVLVPRHVYAESKKVMKAIRKTVKSKKPSEQELQTALSVQIGAGENRPICEKCAKKFKAGPPKFADLIEEEEPEGAEQAGGEEQPKKKGGFFSKLRRTKEA